MSEKEPLNGINESLKQIVDIMKPKPKKADKVAIFLWLAIGVAMMCALYYIYVIFEK